jgi:anti-sigma B factor antagonist
MLPNGTEIDQNGSVITCHVHLSEMAREEMQDLIDECMNRMRCDNAQNFVFDLSQVEFLASSCMGVLVGFLQDIEHVKGRVALANCQENVRFLFKVTRLDSIFAMYDDVQDAVASF